MTEQYNTVAADVARWLTDAMGRKPYGELVAVVKLHEGRVPIVQLTETTSIKTEKPHYAGNPGGTNDTRRR